MYKSKENKIINFQTESDKAYETPVAFEYLILLYLPIKLRIYVLFYKHMFSLTLGTWFFLDLCIAELSVNLDF